MIARVQPSLVNRWRRSISCRGQQSDDPRSLGALGYRTNGPVLGGLIEVEKLVLVVLYDELIHDGRNSLTLAGFSGRPIPWGVCWGDRRGSKFFKDLCLEPASQARGRRIDADDEELLQLGLELERQLQRHHRHRWLRVRRHPLLPRLWAGFRHSDAQKIDGDGPELATACKRRCLSPHQILESARRECEDLVLYPLEWVSHHWRQAAALLADVSRLPMYQVFAIDSLPDDLQGFRGAAAFDFFNSRFRSSARRRSRRCAGVR